MIFFAEINKTDNEHEVINGCLLQMIYNIFSEDEVVFWGSEKHFVHLKIDVKRNLKKKFINVLAPKDGNKLFWTWKFCREARLIWSLLKSAQQSRVKLVFFSSLSIPGNFFINHLALKFFKEVPVVITLHGELGLLSTRMHQTRVERNFATLLKKALRCNTGNINYLLLGELIREEVLESNLLRKERILCIEHPYTFPAVTTRYFPSLVPAFGHLGIAKRSKNSHFFFKLAERFYAQIQAGLVKFTLIGRMWNDFGFDNQGLIEFEDTFNFLDRDTYIRRIQQIDYAVFFYDDNQYGITGSGAIMDAIAYDKPILCLKNKFFTQLFSSTTEGKPGWIFEDMESMFKKINDIIAGEEKDKYEDQVKCIKSLKSLISVKSIEKRLASELSHKGYLFHV